MNEIRWQQMHIFWADERCVPPDDLQSNYGQANQLLLSHVPIPSHNIHPINGTLEPAVAAQQYEQELRRFTRPDQQVPIFDWVLLGMGTDGHTASLFPGQSEPPYRLSFPTQVNYDSRPAQRVSLTSYILNQADEIVFMVTGESKAAALQKVVEGKPDPHNLPAQRIKPCKGQVTWLIDSGAASLLSNC